MNLWHRCLNALTGDATTRALHHRIAELTAERDQALAEKAELESENARLTAIVDGVTALAVHHEKQTGWMPTSELRPFINLDAEVAA